MTASRGTAIGHFPHDVGMQKRDQSLKFTRSERVEESSNDGIVVRCVRFARPCWLAYRSSARPQLRSRPRRHFRHVTMSAPDRVDGTARECVGATAIKQVGLHFSVAQEMGEPDHGVVVQRDVRRHPGLVRTRCARSGSDASDSHFLRFEDGHDVREIFECIGAVVHGQRHCVGRGRPAPPERKDGHQCACMMSGYAEGFGSCFEAECCSSPERRTEHLVLGHGFERRPERERWSDERQRDAAHAGRGDRVDPSTGRRCPDRHPDRAERGRLGRRDARPRSRNSRNPCGTAFR